MPPVAAGWVAALLPDPDGAYFGGIANSFFSGLNDFARDAVGRTLTSLAFGGNFFLGHSVYDRYIRGSGFDDVLYGGAIAGAGFIPGVGEAFDAYDLFRPSSARWERGLAAASLGLSAYTAGGSPNYGSTIRGARHVARGADKLWATGSRLYNSARSTWRSWRGGGGGGGAIYNIRGVGNLDLTPSGVDSFMARNHRRLRTKLGDKIGGGKLPFEKGRAGFDAAVSAVDRTLRSSTDIVGPFITTKGQNTVADVYSRSTDFTVRIRADGVVDTVIKGPTSRIRP